MLRTTLGLSFLVIGGLVACSSKATSKDDGAGGNGAIVGSGGSSAGTGGVAGTGASTTPGAGTAASTAGTAASTAGAAGTSSSGGACAGMPVTCADTTRVNVCNSMTGAVETLNCIDEYATLGFVSTGCSADDTGVGCDLTEVKDEPCRDGAAAFAFCVGATDDEQLFNLYVNCYQDFMGAHAIIPCFADYVSATMTDQEDCDAAADACIPAGGAGPGPDAGDAGGAP